MMIRPPKKSIFLRKQNKAKHSDPSKPVQGASDTAVETVHHIEDQKGLQTEPMHQPDVALDHQKILLVEDDPFLRDLYHRIFQRANLEISFAEDGEEGFDKIRELHPTLVLLDVMLPGITGLELLTKLNKEGHPLPMIIMLTDLDQAGVKEKALQLGAIDFISKNEVSGPELVQRVERILKAQKH
jgi:CheY-like chemotaxis protein